MHLSLLQASLKVRLALLLGALLLVFLASAQWLRMVEQERSAQWQQDSVSSNALLLRKWIDFNNQPLHRFVRDFSQWEALASFVAHADPAWAEANLKPNLARYDIHALWVLDPTGRVVFSAGQQAGAAVPPPPAPPALGQPANASFFAESADGLLEVRREPITGPNGSAGWLLAARLWDAAHVVALGQLSEAELLVQPAGTAIPPNQPSLGLLGADGRPIRQLVVQPANTTPDAGESPAEHAVTAYLFLAFGVLLVLALWLAVRQWILQPLDRIGESLRQDNPAAIQPLLKERNELGRVAQLIESSFRQKAALGREVDDRRRTEEALRESESRLRHALEVRARLARDLHDGVIQSIYAAGLGLEGAIAQLEKDLAGARSKLQLCRQSLNDVIREVRAFISGIEPEALHHQGFEQELAALARTMQALWPVVIEVSADSGAVARMTASQELHALQICRECISNAVRHGGAREISIRLGEPEAGQACLRVRDNGRGFNPTANRSAGSGLGNLATRARELGGRLEIESHPGGGACFTVTFPLTTPA